MGFYYFASSLSKHEYKFQLLTKSICEIVTFISVRIKHL